MRLAQTLPVVAAAAVLSAPRAALACSCMPYSSAAEQLQASQLVFKGHAVAEQSTGPDRARTTFRVVEVLKGPAARTIRVEHHLDGAACGVRYRTGKTVWVFASRGPKGEWRTGLCSAPRFDEADYRRAARGEAVPEQPRVF